uniref:Uncharacterized protein n=1 Tax=Salix viminalis TaxID=40686 RepID=A0A6N2NKE5_SALVM
MSDPNKGHGHGHGHPSTSFAGLPPPRWGIKWKIIVEALQFYPSCSSSSEKKQLEQFDLELSSSTGDTMPGTITSHAGSSFLEAL